MKKFLVVYDAYCMDHFGEFLPDENKNNFEFIKGKTNLNKFLSNFRRLERLGCGSFDIKRVVELR